MGFVNMFGAWGVMVLPPVIGRMVDVSGTFVSGFYVLSGVALLGSLASRFVTPARRSDYLTRRRLRRTEVYDALITALAIIGAVTCLIWLVKAVKALAAKAAPRPFRRTVQCRHRRHHRSHLRGRRSAPYCRDRSGGNRPMTMSPPSPPRSTPSSVHIALSRSRPTEPASDRYCRHHGGDLRGHRSSHRIVHIEDANKATLWAAEGRRMHQTSHRPH